MFWILCSSTMFSLPYGSHNCTEKPGNSYSIIRGFSGHELLLAGGREPLSWSRVEHALTQAVCLGALRLLCSSLCSALLQRPHGIKSTLRSTLCAQSLSPVWLSVTPWTAALQAALSMGFSRQEYWSGWPCPPPGDLPDPGMQPLSFMPPASAGRFFTTHAT